MYFLLFKYFDILIYFYGMFLHVSRGTQHFYFHKFILVTVSSCFRYRIISCWYCFQDNIFSPHKNEKCNLTKISYNCLHIQQGIQQSEYLILFKTSVYIMSSNCLQLYHPWETQLLLFLFNLQEPTKMSLYCVFCCFITCKVFS